MKEETLKIEGMTCGHCVMAVKKELQKLNLNVKDVQIGKAIIEYDDAKVSRKQIEEAVDEAGYKVVN